MHRSDCKVSNGSAQKFDSDASNLQFHRRVATDDTAHYYNSMVLVSQDLGSSEIWCWVNYRQAATITTTRHARGSWPTTSARAFKH